MAFFFLLIQKCLKVLVSISIDFSKFFVFFGFKQESYPKVSMRIKHNVNSDSFSNYKEWMRDVENVAKIGRWEIETGNDSVKIKWTKGVFNIFELSRDKIPDMEEQLGFFLDEYKANVKEQFQELIESGNELEFEARIKTLRGTIKWIKVLGKRTKNGENHTCIGTIQEIGDLKKIELQQKLLLNNTEEFFVVVDKKYSIVTFNEQFAKEYEKLFDRKVKKGGSILDYSTGSPEQLKKVYQNVFSGAKEKRELRYPGREGTEDRFYSMIYKPAYDEIGNSIIGAFVTVRDITDEVKAKKELEIRENRFRALVENGADGIAILNTDGSLKYITPSIKKILGYSVEEIMNITLFDLLHPDDVDGIENKMMEVISRPGIPIKGHTSRLKHKNGHWVWLEAVITNMLEDPTVAGIVDNFRDITEQVEAEIQLEMLYERLSKHLENSPLGVVEYDKDLRITKWSKKCEDIFGWTEQEILESETSAFDLIYDDDAPKVTVIASELASGIEEGNVSINRNYTKEGKIIDCVWYNSVIKKKDGSVDTIMSLVQDITQRLKSDKELQDSNKEKSILLAEIHHRVKNNLAIISGLIQLQIFKVKDENLVNVLLSSISRIKSIALIHEQLYTSQDFRNISFDRNIEKLVASISEIMNPSDGITVNYDLKNINLNINQAIPCALFVNEAVTNVFKHAFEERLSGILEVKCSIDDNNVSIMIKDDGHGFDTSKYKSTSDSLGVKLLEMVSEQLHGTLEMKSDKEKGTSVKLSFEKSEEVSGSSARVLNY